MEQERRSKANEAVPLEWVEAPWTSVAKNRLQSWKKEFLNRSTIQPGERCQWATALNEAELSMGAPILAYLLLPTAAESCLEPKNGHAVVGPCEAVAA